MCADVVSGSEITPEQLEAAPPRILYYRDQEHAGLDFFTEIVEPLIEKEKPDLIWIDPLLAYLGGDQNNQEVVGRWLRNWLNPLLTKYNCGAILVHHTAKLTQAKIKDGWVTGDFSYLGAGSAEFANHSRAIVCLMPTEAPGVFGLHAPKRGMRLGWKDQDGKPTSVRCIHHSRKQGEICWHEAKGVEVSFAKPQNGKPIPTMEQFIGILPRLDATNPRGGL